MTPEAQRSTILEACGWIFDGPDDYMHYLSVKRWISPSGQHGLFAPDYLNDRNAMHGAFMGLHTISKIRFHLILDELVKNPPDKAGADFQYKILEATVPQWAEAFIKTLGLWTS